MLEDFHANVLDSSLQLPTVLITHSSLFIPGLFDNWKLGFTVVTSFLSNLKFS